MIITKTPVRISFFGGGTDYPDYFLKHGGATLSTTIDKYVFVTVHPVPKFADWNLRLFYSKVETVKDLEEIEHIHARECLRFLGIKSGIEIHYIAHLPARVGVGSSSAATVGLLHALHAFKGEIVTKQQLAEEAVYIEQEMVKERIGCQDQYAAAIGGLLHLEFSPEKQVRVNPLVLSKDRLDALDKRLMLFYTGIQRTAHEVLEEQIQKTKSGANDEYLHKMKESVHEGIDILKCGRDLREFGELLHVNWVLKRKLSDKVSTPEIDELYERARKAGALGGKITGAGGGGFLLLYVEPENQNKVRKAVPELREAEFSFENSGSQLIFFHP